MSKFTTFTAISHLVGPWNKNSITIRIIVPWLAK